MRLLKEGTTYMVAHEGSQILYKVGLSYTLAIEEKTQKVNQTIFVLTASKKHTMQSMSCIRT